jgi:hypothetical protein
MCDGRKGARAPLLDMHSPIICAYGIKFRSSGSDPAIGTSKKRLGSGCMTNAPSEAKKIAICSWAPRAMVNAKGVVRQNLGYLDGVDIARHGA